MGFISSANRRTRRQDRSVTRNLGGRGSSELSCEIWEVRAPSLGLLVPLLSKVKNRYKLKPEGKEQTQMEARGKSLSASKETPGQASYKSHSCQEGKMEAKKEERKKGRMGWRKGGRDGLIDMEK